MGVPGVEPAGEGGGFAALLDGDKGRVKFASRRVGSQVIQSAADGLLGLVLIGRGTNPQEDLESVEQGRETETTKERESEREREPE